MKESYNKTDNRIFNFFYLMTVGVLTAWVMVAGIVDTTIFQRTHLLNLIRVFFTVLAFGLILKHEVVTKIAFWLFAAATIFIVTGFMMFALVPEGGGIAFNTAELILRTVQYVLGMRAHMFQYENIIVWLLIVSFSFVVVYFGYVRFKFWLLLVLSTVTTSIAITSPYFREERIFYVFIFCLLVLVVVKLQQLNQIKINNPHKTSKLSSLIIPVTAVVVMFATMIPTPPTGGDDGFFRRVARAPFDFVNNVFSDLTMQAEFSLTNVGFGGRGGRLGGNAVLNDRVFMRITTDSLTAMPIYLTGATSDTYTGYSWLNLHTEYEDVDFSDFYQQIELIERVLGENLSQYVPMIDSVMEGRLVPLDLFGGFAEAHPELLQNYRFFINEVTYLFFQAYVPGFTPLHVVIPDEIPGTSLLTIDTLNTRMTSLFHAGIVRNMVSTEGEMMLSRTRDGRIVSNNRLPRGTAYQVYHTDLNRSYTIWGLTLGGRILSTNPLQYSYRGVLSDIVLMLETFSANYGYYIMTPKISPAIGEVLTYIEIINNYLIPRSEQIHEIYLQLPDTLPERVRQLAEYVTADATTDFERMVLLESFLRENFRYTLSPGPSPVGQDFVDHFLFDIQVGYCVHFATAFVVMARALGMPTRYVEGFMVHEPDEHGNPDIYVRNNMAHAWPEVYFEGYGWVRFEPTPAYDGIDEPGFTGGIGGILGSGGGFWEDDNIPYEPNQGQDREPVPQQNGTSQAPSQGNAGNASDATDNIRISIPTIVWVISGFTVVPIAFFARYRHIKYKRNRFSGKDNNEMMKREYQRLLVYLQLLGHSMRPSETEIAFMKRVKGELDLPLLVDATQIYVKGRYSDLEITDDELIIFEKINTRLDERVTDLVGKVRYYWYRDFIGRI